MIEYIDYIIDYYEKIDNDVLATDIVITLRDAEELIFLHQTEGLNKAHDNNNILMEVVC